ncbi:MAG: His-Xaa-Ser system radical SAM maturase HxsC [Acidobacteriota bacterium]|nr:His-Xaa-Ser system radical SAM maturase HxsC [Acidobacteriota bacterium]
MRLHSTGRARDIREPIIARVATAGLPPGAARKDSVLVWKGAAGPADASGYMAVVTPERSPVWNPGVPLVHSVSGLDYLSDGDVVDISPSGFVRTLYRRNSPHNFILATDQCNSFCLMCSQPPKQVDDFDRIGEHLRLIDLIDPETAELGITGGEPTLFKDDFLRLVEYCRDKLPRTALHVLTNGRLFYYREFARRLGEIAHPDLMLGIPLYSDVDSEHDYVVQAKGAFEETVLGLHNLGRYGVPAEVRVVVHKQTYRRLPRLAEFISRNFPFAAHVALMGMEMFGFVHRNMDELWIDPHDYQVELREATETLFLAGMNVSIYNHQLCVLDEGLWPFARKSISDWKNIYLEECGVCALRERCGGLFQSAAKKHSAHIRPLAGMPGGSTPSPLRPPDHD